MESINFDSLNQTLPAEKNNKVSVISSVLSWIGSGLISIQKVAY